MKSIKLITLLLLIAFAFSAFTACDLIMGGTDKPGDQVTENPDDKPGDTPGGDSGNVPDECKHANKSQHRWHYNIFARRLQ